MYAQSSSTANLRIHSAESWSSNCMEAYNSHLGSFHDIVVLGALSTEEIAHWYNTMKQIATTNLL